MQLVENFYSEPENIFVMGSYHTDEDSILAENVLTQVEKKQRKLGKKPSLKTEISTKDIRSFFVPRNEKKITTDLIEILD